MENTKKEVSREKWQKQDNNNKIRKKKLWGTKDEEEIIFFFLEIDFDNRAITV